MIIRSNNKKVNIVRVGMDGMQDMIESRTTKEEFRKQFGTCCGIIFETNVKERSVSALWSETWLAVEEICMGYGEMVRVMDENLERKIKQK